MKTKSKNDTAFHYSIGFSIVVYFILLLHIGLFAAHINEVILVLIPILIIEFSKAIFEALADKNEVYIYEKNRKTLGILAPMIASIVILIFIMMSITKTENSSSDVALFIVAFIIIFLVAIFSILVVRRIEDNKSQRETKEV